MNPRDPIPLAAAEETVGGMFDALLPLAARWRLLLFGTLLGAVTAFGITFLLTPMYTGRVTFLPPQQSQASATGPLAQLGTIAAALGGPTVKTPTDQFVGLAQSVTVADRLIEKFDLLKHYDEEFRVEARKELAKRMRIAVGKRDGFVTIEIDDESPERSAQMANQVVDELRLFSDRIALTEAKQRRIFFEGHLQQTRERLEKAQRSLVGSGFTEGSLKAEPRSAAEAYARLRAEVTASEVRLQALQRALTGDAVEVQQQQAGLAALRSKLAALELTATTNDTQSTDYVARYRELKYQETLFELFARQFELARVDESRDGGLVQVIDPATPAERRSWPRRSVITVVAALATLLLLCVAVLAAHSLRQPAAGPDGPTRRDRLRDALARR